MNDLNKKFEKLNCNPEDLKVDCGDDLTIDDILKPVKNNSSKENEQVHENDEEGEESDEEENYDDEDEDDDDGWITPSMYSIRNYRF